MLVTQQNAHAPAWSYAAREAEWHATHALRERCVEAEGHAPGAVKNGRWFFTVHLKLTRSVSTCEALSELSTPQPHVMSVIEEENIALLFKRGEDLSTAISKTKWKDSSQFPELRVSCKQLELTKDEEERVNKVFFPEDLHFSVPVNLRDSKTAYLTLMEDTDMDDMDVTQDWDYGEFSGKPQGDGDTAETTEEPAVAGSPRTPNAKTPHVPSPPVN